MITLTRGQPIGWTLRNLRLDAGLTLSQVAERARISRSGIAKRELSRGGTVGMVLDHARALGFDVALVPARHAGARHSGTGWPT